jgi:hypothetical protein
MTRLQKDGGKSAFIGLPEYCKNKEAVKITDDLLKITN